MRKSFSIAKNFSIALPPQDLVMAQTPNNIREIIHLSSLAGHLTTRANTPTRLKLPDAVVDKVDDVLITNLVRPGFSWATITRDTKCT
jgi:hypothetical protein